MDNIIECNNLTHYYGSRCIYKDLSFEVKRGSILGLLGKNGTGKTTTINILNGYLKPTAGHCAIFGENSQRLSADAKRRIGFLLEGHIQYGFMNVTQIEKFFKPFYPGWKSDAYFELMNKLKIAPRQKISTMSCGQRSQVALGLILAQDPELMILDDFSMGLDPGYRRLFIEYLKEWANSQDKTIFTTSHIIQDMEILIDDCMIMDYGKLLISMPTQEFLNNFREFKCTVDKNDIELEKSDLIKNYEVQHGKLSVYSFGKLDEVTQYVNNLGINHGDIIESKLSLEDAFIGLTGKY
ncbi:MAG: ABC transporter ATP-binding protein [Bacteroidales bacterium]|jgi:ABC-2 type transport system ATP-binding protein|nr:ABC transporter ATP-binding protein [Bacteroidales bacterium]